MTLPDRTRIEMNKPLADSNGTLDRRQWLFMAAGTVLTGACASETIHSSQTSRRDSGGRIRKAVGIGMIAEGGTLVEKFQLLKELGFDGVEVNRPDTVPIADILRARDAAKIQIANVVDSVHWGKTLSDPDSGVRRLGREGLEAALHDARALDCETVLLVPAVVNEKVSYAEAYERSQEEIRKVIPLAEALNVNICIENVWNNFLLSPLEAARYVDELGSRHVGFHFDVGNVILYGWPEQWIATLGPRIRNVHIKEYSRKKLDNEGRWKGFDVDLLEGSNRWREIMAALHSIRYSGWAVAEIQGGDRARLKTIASKMDQILSM
jgi:hexulose-6-phosphate isomerase